MLLEERYDPMGHAIRDYYERRPVRRLRVLSSLFDEDEMPVGHLFRSVDDMNLLERTALGLCHGRVLDVGAGAGCHSLALQERGLAVTAVDVSPLSVGVMRRRGVRDARLADFFADDLGGPFDTVLLLMNGIGLCGRLEGLPRFFARLGALLAPGGAVLADSSDLRYIFEDEEGRLDYDPADGYYGEVDYRMRYGAVKDRPFDWLYADFDTLAAAAGRAGFRAELLLEGGHYDYLARISRR